MTLHEIDDQIALLNRQYTDEFNAHCEAGLPNPYAHVRPIHYQVQALRSQRRERVYAAGRAARELSWQHVDPVIPEGDWDAEDLGDAIDAAEAMGHYSDPPLTDALLAAAGYPDVMIRDLRNPSNPSCVSTEAVSI